MRYQSAYVFDTRCSVDVLLKPKSYNTIMEEFFETKHYLFFYFNQFSTRQTILYEKYLLIFFKQLNTTDHSCLL